MLLRGKLAMLGLALIGGPCLAIELNFATEEFRPFSYSSGRVRSSTGMPQADGAISDVVRAACERLQYQCNIEVYPWRRALQLAENGEVDGLFTVIRSPRPRAGVLYHPHAGHFAL